MNGRYLLDTNIIIALFAHDAQAKASLINAEQIFVPSIAIGELCYGARKSGRVAQNLLRIEHFAATNVVLECNMETARHYGEIKNKLRQKGRPVPENDIWIAALAIQHDLRLATRDEHFQEVERLILVKW